MPNLSLIPMEPENDYANTETVRQTTERATSIGS